jgi:oxygen-independent coproporphyrinogen-3 oxidase
MEMHKYQWLPLTTLYLGGGTPSLWGQDGARFLGEWLQDRLKLAVDCEFTMEIDPGTWTPTMLDSWKAIGLNRISIGTQTLDPGFLKIMDRSHSLDESFELLTYCEQEDINFSLDFLLGLPYSKEKKRNIKKELERLLEFNPKHISLYILNARSKYPHVQSLPDDDFIREEYLLVSEFLQSQGFIHYEVSNFALPGFEAIHNKKYWQGEAVAAFGPTGTGYLPTSQSSAIRYKWKVSKADVEEELLGLEELRLESTYLSLRTNQGWRPTELTSKMEEIFKQWQEKGYGTFKAGQMVLNATGFILLDSLMDDLFRARI